MRYIVLALLLIGCTKEPYDCNKAFEDFKVDFEYRRAQCERFEPDPNGPCWSQLLEYTFKESERVNKEMLANGCR